MPIPYFLPLLNILASERTVHNGKQCFAVNKDAGSSKEAIQYLDLALYVEKDLSITIEMKEIS